MNNNNINIDFDGIMDGLKEKYINIDFDKDHLFELIKKINIEYNNEEKRKNISSLEESTS